LPSQLFLSLEGAAGWVLTVSNLFMLTGVLMFWFRDGVHGGAPRSRTHFILERSFIMAAVIVAAIGFILLEEIWQDTNGNVLGTIGATAYLFAGVLLVAGEALSLTHGYEKLLPIIIVYVILAFLAQAAIGGAILLSGMTAAWIGWATVVWNIGWLVALPLISPRDIYFPILHSVAPLVIGIAILAK
jgi:hypothetical protein